MKTLEELKDIRDAHDNLKLVSVLLPHPGFPVDIRHNAKINREILKLWAQEELNERAGNGRRRIFRN